MNKVVISVCFSDHNSGTPSPISQGKLSFQTKQGSHDGLT